MRIQEIHNKTYNNPVNKTNRQTFTANMKVVKAPSKALLREAKVKGLSNLDSRQLIEFNEALPHFDEVARTKYDIKIVIHPEEFFEEKSQGHLVKFFILSKTNNYSEKIKRIYNTVVKGEPNFCVVDHRFEDRVKGWHSYCWKFRTDNLIEIFDSAVRTFERTKLEADKKKRLMKFYGKKNSNPEMMRIVRDMEYGKPKTIFDILEEKGIHIEPLSSGDIEYDRALYKQLSEKPNLRIVKDDLSKEE